MCDIEDLVETSATVPRSPLKEFNIRVRTKRKEFEGNSNQEEEKPIIQSDLPWSKTVFLKTWGCSHNGSDSEYMGGLLTAAGFKVSNDKDNSDIWLLNSCTVKTPSEAQLENMIKEAQKLGKCVVVAGCVSQAAPSESYLKNVSIVGVKQIDQIVNVVEETLKGNTVRLLSLRSKTTPVLSLPKMRRNKFIEILAINSGCLNNCTYCKTKMARGNLQSYPLESLVEQARTAFEVDGCKELWLTSEDLGAWGRDIQLVLPDLLKELVKVIPEGCMMRLGMTNPPYILDHLEEIAEILNHPKVYSFLHIPVQAGSNAVLDDMKREYTNEHFCQVVDFMKERVPDIYIATDFICAFPTETPEDFEESLALVRKYEFPSLFINQFFPRPGTPAARLKKIDGTESKRRTSAMTELFHSYRRYKPDRIGMVYDVLICEVATDGKSFVGHNKCYEHILVPRREGEDLLGKWAKVKITEVAKFYMKSEIIETEKKLPTGQRENKLNEFGLAGPLSIVALLGYLLIRFLMSFY